MIKYLGSKRALAGVLGTLAEGSGARTAVDLFTGTTRVAQEFKRRGLLVTAADLASYSEVLARCYIATDADAVDAAELDALLAELNALPGVRGYVTETFCEQARFFQPHNGERIDAIREHLTALAGHRLYPVLLTALMEAADRVDSTTGQHMAYLKSWAPPGVQRVAAAASGAAAGHRTSRCAAMRLRGGARAARHRPDVPRPALQPAPLLHLLPHLGDAGPLGFPAPLRGCLQAGGRPLGAARQRLQLAPHHAERARRRDHRRAPRW